LCLVPFCWSVTARRRTIHASETLSHHRAKKGWIEHEGNVIEGTVTPTTCAGHDTIGRGRAAATQNQAALYGHHNQATPARLRRETSFLRPKSPGHGLGASWRHVSNIKMVLNVLWDGRRGYGHRRRHQRGREISRSESGEMETRWWSSANCPQINRTLANGFKPDGAVRVNLTESACSRKSLIGPKFRGEIACRIHPHGSKTKKLGRSTLASVGGGVRRGRGARSGPRGDWRPKPSASAPGDGCG